MIDFSRIGKFRGCWVEDRPNLEIKGFLCCVDHSNFEYIAEMQYARQNGKPFQYPIGTYPDHDE